MNRLFSSASLGIIFVSTVLGTSLQGVIAQEPPPPGTSSASISSEMSSVSSSSASSEPVCIDCGCVLAAEEPPVNDWEWTAYPDYIPTEDDIDPPPGSFTGGLPPGEGQQFVALPWSGPSFPFPPHVLAPSWQDGPPAAMSVQRPDLNSRATFGYSDTTPIMRLRNRGIMLSRREYANGSCVRINWQWVGGNDSSFDALTIVFRTNGTQRARPYEIERGIAVKFFPNHIQVLRYDADQAAPTLMAQRDNLTFNRNVETSITITERLNSIEIRYGLGANDVMTVSNNELNQGAQNNANFPARAAGNGRVAIYNREAAGGIIQESHIYRQPNHESIRALAAE